LPGWNLRAIWTPGHTPGHLCFVEPDRKLLFTGDHVLPRITPAVAVHPQSTQNPLAEFLDSLHAVRKLDVDEVMPAHEFRFLELAGRVDYMIGHHEARLAEIEEAVTETPGLSCWEITTRLTWSRPWGTMLAYQQRSEEHTSELQSRENLV